MLRLLRTAPATVANLPILESLSMPNVDIWVAYEHRWAALLNGSYSETHWRDLAVYTWDLGVHTGDGSRSP